MIRKVFLSALLLAGRASAQGVDWAKVHEITLQGIDKLYNLDVEEAEAKFDRVIQMAPNDPRGHFFKSMVHFWIFNLTKDDSAYQRFFEISETVIKLCEAQIDQNENDGVAKFYLGGIYGFRGLAYQRNGSILKAAWDGKKGYSYLKEATKGSPEVYDAQMGFGLFNYLVAKVPKAFRWILSILGFSGDLEGGLESLRIAADRGTYAKNEATLFLAQFLFIENREEEAYKYMNRLLEKYPDNPLFLLTYASWELRKDNAETALEVGKKAVALNARRRIRYGDELAYNVVAVCYYLKNDFRNASAYFDSSIQRTENKHNVSNYTYYRLGISYEILGERSNAILAYAQVRKADMNGNQFEYHYYRLAQKRLRIPLGPFDILAVKAGNAHALKKYQDAAAMYNQIAMSSAADVDQRAGALYGLLQIYYDQGKYEEALQAGRELLAIRPEQEKWIIPHGRFKVGQVYARLGRTTEARREFEAVDDYDDYDFQNRLESRVEEELNKLKGVN
jgi:tetratricopeptide (TPR) repeat protein